MLPLNIPYVSKLMTHLKKCNCPLRMLLFFLIIKKTTIIWSYLIKINNYHPQYYIQLFILKELLHWLLSIVLLPTFENSKLLIYLWKTYFSLLLLIIIEQGNKGIFFNVCCRMISLILHLPGFENNFQTNNKYFSLKRTFFEEKKTYEWFQKRNLNIRLY